MSSVLTTPVTTPPAAMPAAEHAAAGDECLRLLNACHLHHEEMQRGERSSDARRNRLEAQGTSADWMTDGTLAQPRPPENETALPSGSMKRAVLGASAAVATAICTLAVLAAVLWFPLRRVPDFRVGRDYRDDQLQSIAADAEAGQVFVGTAQGLESFTQAEFLQHYDKQSTRGGLLEDHVQKVARGADGRIYILCRNAADQTLGLCRFSPATGEWEPLVRTLRFPELTSPERTARITAVLPLGDSLLIGTDSAGLARYRWQEHGWQEIFRKGTSGLNSNVIYDLLQPAEGGPLAATDRGLQQFTGGTWSDVPLPAEIEVPDIRQLAERSGSVWLRTASGELYARDATQWNAVAADTSWDKISDDQVAQVFANAAADQWWFLANDNRLARYDLTRRAWTKLPPAPAGTTAIDFHPALDSRLLAASPAGLSELAGDGSAWTHWPQTPGNIAALSTSEQLTIAALQPDSPDESLAAIALSPSAAQQTLVGYGGPVLGAKGAMAVSADSSGKRLFVGGEAGLNVYDAISHEWKRPAAAAIKDAGIVELQTDGPRQLVLRADGSLYTWNPDSDQATWMLGGGELPKDLSEVTAVTRDAQGALYLAARDGLFLYDTQRHAGRKLADLSVPVSQMTAAAGGVWLLASGSLSFCDAAGNLIGETNPSGRLQRIFSSPTGRSAVALDEQGRVYRYDDPKIAPAIVVGDAASGLDLSKVDCAAADADWLIVGGRQPHVYQTRSRHWQPLACGPLSQVILSNDAAWLRTADQKVFRLDKPAPNTQVLDPRPIAELDGTVELAGHGGWLAARKADFSIWSLPPDGVWSESKPAAFGPASSALGATPLVAGNADYIDLATAPNGAWWRFSWPEDRWEAVEDASGRMTGLTAMASAGGTTYAIGRDQQLYGLALGGRGKAAIAAKVRMKTLRSSHGRAIAVDEQYRPWNVVDGVWQPLIDAPLNGSGNLQDVAATTGGLVVATTGGTALLDDELAAWTPISGGESIDRLHVAADQILASTGDRQLVKLSRVGDSLSWEEVLIEGKHAVARSVAASAGPAKNRLTITTDSGAVFRIDGGGAPELLRLPGIAPGKPGDVVDIVPRADGSVLAATRSGRLLTCSGGSFIWSQLSSAKPHKRLLRTESAAGSPAYWLLFDSGELSVSKTAAPEPWKVVDVGIDQIVAAADHVVAWSASKGVLAQIGADGERTVLIHGTPPFPDSFAGLRAAGELPAAGRRLLLLSDGRQTAAYDPQLRAWTSHEVAADAFHPIAAGAVAFTQDGGAIRLEWARDQVTTAEYTLPSGFKPVAAIQESGDVVCRAGTATLVAVSIGGERRTLVARNLPPAAMSGQIAHIAGDGDVLFLALQNGLLFAYLPEYRTWQKVGEVAGLRRMAALGDVLWTEGELGGEPSFGAWSNAGDAGWKYSPVAESIAAWHLAADGIVAATTNGGEPLHYVAPDRPTTIGTQLPAGPAEPTIAAVRHNPHGLWLHDDAHSLFHYDHVAHGWRNVSPAKGLRLRAAAFRGKLPLLADVAKTLWLGERISQADRETWSFRERAVGVRVFDAEDNRAVWLTADRLVSAAFDAEEAAQAEQKQTRAWTKDAKATLAAARGSELWVASDGGELAQFDLASRVWTAHAAPKAAIGGLAWVDDRPLATGDAGVLQWDGSGWLSPKKASQATFGEGDAERGAHPHGGFSRGGVPEEQTPPPLDSVEPRRLFVAEKVVWLEMTDGSLLHYDPADHRLSRDVKSPKNAEIKRTGLISTGDRVYFLAEQERRVAELPLDGSRPQFSKIPDDFVATNVLVNAGEVGLDSGAEVWQVSTSKRLAGAERDAWLKGATAVVGDRLQTADAWRIEPGAKDQPAVLAWKINDSWHKATIVAATSRFAWDDVHGGLAWRDHTLVATSAGVAVYSAAPAGLPKQLLAIESVRIPLKLHLASFEEDKLLVAAADGRVWRLVESESGQPFDLQPVEQPESKWRIERQDGGIAFSAQLAEEELVPLSLSAGGVWGCDRIAAVALAGGRLYAATADGLLELSLDLANILHVHRQQAGLVLSLDDGSGIRFRAATGQVERFDGAEWHSDTESAWKAAVDQYALRERAERNAPIALPLVLQPGQPAVSVAYRAGRLECDALADLSLANLTAYQEHTWIGNRHGVLILPRTAKAADKTPRLPKFLPLPAGCVSLQWDRRSGNAVLLATGGDKRLYRVEPDGLTLAETTPSEPAGTTVRLGKQVYEVSIGSPSAAELTPLSEGAPARTLDLPSGAFRHDLIHQVGGGANAVWFTADGQLERLLMDRPDSLRKAMADAQAIQFRHLGDTLVADTGKVFYELTDTGEPAPLEISAEDAAELQAGLLGNQWRWPRLSAPEALYLAPGQPWRRFAFDARQGFAIDQVKVFAAHEDELHLATAAGLIRMPLARAGLDNVRPAPLSAVPGAAAQVRRFWTSPKSGLWAETTAGSWQRFQPTGGAWEHFDQLPAAEQAAEAVLCSTRATVWQRGASGIEIHHKPAGADKDLVLQWKQDGQFDINDVRSASETETSVWLLTPAGLWETDSASGEVINGDRRPEFTDCEGEFVRGKDGWRVSLRQGEQPAGDYRLVDGAWQPATEPPAAEWVWQRPNFRVYRAAGQLTFELRTQPDNQWMPTTFHEKLGRFSFQIAGDAGATEKHLHCATPDGVATWRETAFGLAFDHLRRDLRSLRTHVTDGSLLAGDSQANSWSSFDGKAWAPFAAPVDDSLLFASARWRCLKTSEGAALQTQDASGAWFELPLSPDGDFAYRRPIAVAVGDGSICAVSGGALAFYDLKQDEPAAVAPARSIAATLPAPLSGAFYEGDALHVVAGSVPFARAPDGRWEQADADLVPRRARTLLSSDGWTWIRGESSSRLARDVAGQEVPLEWDAQLGRFHLDQASDAAPVAGSLLISTPKGVLQLDPTTHAATTLLAHEGPSGRFAYDRREQQLLFRPEAAEASPLALDVAQAPWTLNAAADAAAATDAFDSAYLDDEWRFQLGASPQVRWNDLPTDLTAGRFRHDDFRGMLLDADGNCWLETPLGAIVYAFEAGVPGWRQTHAWPSTVPVRLIDVQSGVPTIRSQGKTYRRADSQAKWTRVEGDAPSERILVDSPLWTWSRKDEAVTALVKQSDMSSAAVTLNPSEPLPFDKLRTVLADGDVAWFGLDDGIVLRKPGESGIGWWYRTGNTSDGAMALGKIVRLGRFTEKGDPLPPSATAAEREAASLFAVNDLGQAWRLEGQSPGEWHQASSDPWQGPHGQWLARSASLQVSRIADNRIVLSCRRETGLPAVSIDEQPQVRLRGGRLTHDVVRGLALTAGSNYLSTDAGIVETTQEGAFKRWWPATTESPPAVPTPWQHIAVHGRTGQVFGIDPAGQLQTLDADAQTWLPATADETFQRTAEVLHSDSFWTLRRWNGAIEISITKCDVQPYDGPLFVDGRFSFDVIRDIRLEDEHLWAITTAGVIQFDPEHMSVLSLSRRAFDQQDESTAALPEAAEFLPTGALRIVDERHVYQFDKARWQRSRKLPEPFERTFTDADGRQIQVTPARSGFGVQVQMTAADGGLIRQGEACQTIPFAEIRGMDWLDGELWLATSDRILRWRSNR